MVATDEADVLGIKSTATRPATRVILGDGSSVVFRAHMKTVEQSSGVMSLTSVSISGPRLHELLLDRQEAKTAAVS
jgi:hypothetical protein